MKQDLNNKTLRFAITMITGIMSYLSTIARVAMVMRKYSIIEMLRERDVDINSEMHMVLLF